MSIFAMLGLKSIVDAIAPACAPTYISGVRKRGCALTAMLSMSSNMVMNMWRRRIIDE